MAGEEWGLGSSALGGSGLAGSGLFDGKLYSPTGTLYGGGMTVPTPDPMSAWDRFKAAFGLGGAADAAGAAGKGTMAGIGQAGLKAMQGQPEAVLKAPMAQAHTPQGGGQALEQMMQQLQARRQRMAQLGLLGAGGMAAGYGAGGVSGGGGAETPR